MAVRASSDGETYSASSDLSHVDNELATLMFTLGMDWANIDTTTIDDIIDAIRTNYNHCLLYTSPSPRDLSTSRMPSSA